MYRSVFEIVVSFADSLQNDDKIFASLQRSSRAMELAKRQTRWYRWNLWVVSRITRMAKFSSFSVFVSHRLTFCRLIKQPRYPKMTKNHVHQFYHSCIYDKEDTKKAFQKYVEVRNIEQDWRTQADLLTRLLLTRPKNQTHIWYTILFHFYLFSFPFSSSSTTS